MDLPLSWQVFDMYLNRNGLRYKDSWHLMYVLCSEEEINVLEIDLIVITNFKEEQDSGGEVWKNSKVA